MKQYINDPKLPPWENQWNEMKLILDDLEMKLKNLKRKEKLEKLLKR